jgi:hypothetical protein
MKKLLLVGNKVDNIDRSKEVDSFDYVVRLNRCNNFGLTGTKTDLLLVDAHKGFYNLYNKDNYYKILESTKSIIFCNLNSYKKDERTIELINHFNKINLWNNAIIIKEHIWRYYNNNFLYLTETEASGSCAPSNFFIMLCYCLKFKSNEYQIYFTNTDINRLFKRGMHDNFPHEKFLKQWLNEGKIFMLS